MVLPRTPDEALVVDVARGLHSGSMKEQAHRILMQVPYSVGYHREEGNVEGFVCAHSIYILFIGLLSSSSSSSSIGIKYAVRLG